MATFRRKASDPSTVAFWLAKASAENDRAGCNIDPEAGAGWRFERERLLAKADYENARSEALLDGAPVTEDDMAYVPYDVIITK